MTNPPVNTDFRRPANGLDPLPPFEEPFFVPKALLILKQWICWRAVQVPGKAKWDKRPVCVATGNGEGFLRLEREATYDEAVAATLKLGLAGVGFVLQAENGLVGIDLDDCRDPLSGLIEPWAQTVLDLNETYAEISPSGRGIRLFVFGDLDGQSSKKGAQVEMYVSGRYLTVTGWHIEGSPWEVKKGTGVLALLKARIDAAVSAVSGTDVADVADRGGPGKTTTTGITGKTPAPGSADAFARHVQEQSAFHKLNDLAMKRFDDWVPILCPTATRRSNVNDGWRVKSADVGRPELQEDLSFHPDGIKWFGTHDMIELDPDGRDRKGGLSPVDAVRLCLRVGEPTSAKEAAEWLCATLEIDPAGLGFHHIGKGPGADTADTADTVIVRASVYGHLQASNYEHEQQEVIVPGYIRNEATLLIGPGGTMKSLFVAQLAVAINYEQARVIGEASIGCCGAVVFYSNEDPPAVLYKRCNAILDKYGLRGTAPAYDLQVWTGRLLVRQGDKIRLDQKEVDRLKALRQGVPGNELAVVVLDTLAAGLDTDESNREFQAMMNLLKGLAEQLNTAIVIVHHFRKGVPGAGKNGGDNEPTVENARGGSALAWSSRNVWLATAMTVKEAQKLGFDPDNRDEYLKLKLDKHNYTGKVAPRWFHKETVDITVRNKRTGAKGTETAPVLVPINVQGTTHRLATWRTWLGKLIAAKGVGGHVRIYDRGIRRDDSVQTILDLGTPQQAKDAIKELEQAGVVVFQENWVKGNLTTSYLIVLGEIPNENKEIEEEEDDNGI